MFGKCFLDPVPIHSKGFELVTLQSEVWKVESLESGEACLSQCHALLLIRWGYQVHHGNVGVELKGNDVFVIHHLAWLGPWSMICLMMVENNLNDGSGKC